MDKKSKKESEDIREQAQNGATLVGMSTKQMQSVMKLLNVQFFKWRN